MLNEKDKERLIKVSTDFQSGRLSSSAFSAFIVKRDNEKYSLDEAITFLSSSFPCLSFYPGTTSQGHTGIFVTRSPITEEEVTGQK